MVVRDNKMAKEKNKKEIQRCEGCGHPLLSCICHLFDESEEDEKEYFQLYDELINE